MEIITVPETRQDGSRDAYRSFEVVKEIPGTDFLTRTEPFYLKGDTFGVKDDFGNSLYFTIQSLLDKGYIKETFPKNGKMVSGKYQLGDEAWPCFLTEDAVSSKVIKVHVTESNVMYDLEVKIEPKETSSYTVRLYNVDSAYIS